MLNSIYLHIKIFRRMHMKRICVTIGPLLCEKNQFVFYKDKIKNSKNDKLE